MYLNLITPINIAEEKEKFFGSATYSPQFIYKWDPTTIKNCLENEPELTPLVNALLQQDMSTIERAASVLFDVTFRPQDLATANALIENIPEAGPIGTAKELAAIITTKLQNFGIAYDVKIVDKHGFQCRPDHKAQVLRISKYVHLQFHTPLSVANHELVHVIRAVNGTYNNILPHKGYLPTEEGLSCLVQDGPLEDRSASAFQHALEYMGSYVSKDAGFREVYTFLRDHGCDAKTAWSRGIRQKFGVRDTASPGGLMKSAMYFYHSQLLRELKKDELVRLFVGKIPLSQLNNYPNYTGVIQQQKIEAFLGALKPRL